MELFKDKEIASSTKNLYIKNLTRLNGGEIKSIKFLDDIEDIKSKIGKYKPTTQRSYIISICSLLKDMKNKKNLYDSYYSLLSQMNADLKVNTSKSESQEKNWLNYDEIRKIYDSYELPTEKKLKKKDFINLRNFMIFSLYMLIPPRRNKDYQIMYISNDMTDKDKNYLDLKEKKFIFNNYKTKKTYQTLEQEIPDELMKVIHLYLKHSPNAKDLKKKKHNIPFIVDEEGDPLKHINSFTHILNKLIGKKIGVSMLRNIYLTHKHSDAQEELEKDTKAMGTSTSTATNHYIKKD